MKTWPLILSILLLVLLAGCKTKQKDVSRSAPITRKSNAYHPMDKELVQHSNTIPVYSTPDSAKRVLGRQPDSVVTENNGTQTHYYSGDGTNNSERLRLHYSGGHLIGKEVVPPDVNNAAPAVSRTLSPKEYGDTAGLPAAPLDPNAATNANFNQQLNLPPRRY